MKCCLAVLLAFSISAHAELRADKVRVADAKKTGSYLADGMFTGGDRAMTEVTVKDIRRAPNPGFERIVIDLESTQGGEPAAISRAPYYQISITPDENRIVFNIWGKPKLAFDAQRVVESFRKSAVIEKIVLLPRVDADTWTFSFELKPGAHPAEVFELGRPVRIILDVKGDAQPKPAPKPKAKTVKHAPKKAAPKHGLPSAVKHPNPTEIESKLDHEAGGQEGSHGSGHEKSGDKSGDKSSESGNENNHGGGGHLDAPPSVSSPEAHDSHETPERGE